MKTSKTKRLPVILEAVANDNAWQAQEYEGNDKENASPNQSTTNSTRVTSHSTTKTIIHVPSVFAVPPVNKLSSYSGLFRCSVLVKKDTFIMYHDGVSKPVLRADKQLSCDSLPKYYLFDISQVDNGQAIPSTLTKSSSRYVGKVRRVENFDIHAFELKPKRTTASSSQSLYLVYEFAPSDWTEMFFHNTKPPRRLCVALYDETSDVCQRGNTLTESISANMKESGSLHSVANPDMGRHVFPSKLPSKNEQGGQYALNFFGRCQMHSEANMQLQDDKGQVIVQLAKVRDDTFNLDFRAPFNSVQAFAFAIAQLCEY